MRTWKPLFRTLTVLILVLMISGMASASPLSVISPGTAFTYQGRLSNGGSPANGSYDLRFKLFADPTTGSPVATVDKGGVSVTNGLFSVLLDFGDVFDGTPLYLEVSVGPGYTPLTPRQALTPTPYAIYAEKAPWSGITGIPAGVGSGSLYQNIVVVAQSGGDFSSIQAALDSISTASDSNRFLVYVAPGVYTEKVTMKPFVDIQGSGELTTKITLTGFGTQDTGTVVGANDAELRFLTVANTGGAPDAIAIYTNGVSPRFTHVTARASGGTSYTFGVFNQSTSSPLMTDVTASATGGTYGYGVFNNGSSPTMKNVTVTASGASNNNNGVYNSGGSPLMMNVIASASGGNLNYGVYNWYALAGLTMTNVSATASGSGSQNVGVENYGSSPAMTGVSASATGAGFNAGVYNEGNSSPAMTGVTAIASGGTTDDAMIISASMVINNSVFSASGGTTNNGLNTWAASGFYTVQVSNSQVVGSTNTITNGSGFTTSIGNSQLSGGPVSIGGGTVSCIGVYDENFASAGYTTCP